MVSLHDRRCWLKSKLTCCYDHRKVKIVLNDLGIPYTKEALELNETKTPSYLEITPNGRLPAIQDPNTNFTLWEVYLLALRVVRTTLI